MLKSVSDSIQKIALPLILLFLVILLIEWYRNKSLINFFKNGKKRIIESKFYENYEKGRLSFLLLLLLFIASIILAISIAIKGPVLLGDKVAITLQTLVVIAGGIPTVYLWIVNQRKKEYEINLETERDLNNRYIKAVEQFSEKKTFMAGAYALSTLIVDWYNLDVSIAKKQPQMEQLARILFNVDKEDKKFDSRVICEQYSSLCRTVFTKNLHLEMINNGFPYVLNLLDLSWLNFQTLPTNLSDLLKKYDFDRVNLKGIRWNDLCFKGVSGISYTDFSYSSLSNANFFKVRMRGINFYKSNLYTPDFRNTHLARVNFQESYLLSGDFRKSTFYKTNFSNVKLDEIDLRAAKIIDSYFFHTDLSTIIVNTKTNFDSFIGYSYLSIEKNLLLYHYCNAGISYFWYGKINMNIHFFSVTINFWSKIKATPKFFDLKYDYKKYAIVAERLYRFEDLRKFNSQ